MFGNPKICPYAPPYVADILSLFVSVWMFWTRYLFWFRCDWHPWSWQRRKLADSVGLKENNRVCARHPLECSVRLWCNLRRPDAICLLEVYMPYIEINDRYYLMYTLQFSTSTSQNPTFLLFIHSSTLLFIWHPLNNTRYLWCSRYLLAIWFGFASSSGTQSPIASLQEKRNWNSSVHWHNSMGSSPWS